MHFVNFKRNLRGLNQGNRESQEFMKQIFWAMKKKG